MSSTFLPVGGISRRQALKAMGACSAVTAGSMMSQILNLRLTNSIMANVDNVQGYKALVCIFLFGGADTFHLLTPNDDDGYDDYLAARGNMINERADLLPIVDANGRAFGLHPGVSELQSLYNDGDAAFLANVGTLVQPASVADEKAGVGVPLGLYSHNDQQQHWMTSVPQSRTQITGWAGRLADVLTDASNTNPAVSMNISVNNLNILQTGDGVAPYVVGINGATRLAGYAGQGWNGERLFTEATDGMLNATYSDLLNRTHARTRRNAIDAAIQFDDATSGVQLQTVFPANNYLASQLQMVAKSIAGRDALGQKRQTFFVAMGGWDHHDNMLDSTSTMFPMVSSAMKAFNDAMIELGVHDDVTTFTATDFGRTLTSNGDGTDHAWGGNSIVMGGAVNGGTIHGAYPDSLAPGNPLDTGRGRLVPTTSVDEMSSDLSQWFGVPDDANLEIVLPNIRNFANSRIGLFS